MRAFERGQRLAAALRCGRCHGRAADREELPAPALDMLAGNVHPTWLVDWLSQEPEAPHGTTIVRRMPHFGLTRREAADLAAWLLSEKPEKGKPKDPEDTENPRERSKQRKEKDSKPSAAEGQRLFVTLGCLACHQHEELGESGLFGGGDLTKIAAKRPQEFFSRWLADPASLAGTVERRGRPDGSVEEIWPADQKVAGWQDPAWRGLPWAPVAPVLVRRRLWVVEAVPRDPYYLFHRIEIALDQETFQGVWSRKFDGQGGLLRSLQFLVYATQATPDGEPMPASSMGYIGAVNVKNNRATIAGTAPPGASRHLRRVPLEPGLFALDRLGAGK